MMEKDSTRRNFLKGTAVAAAGAALSSTIARTAHAQGSDEIRFALIGCGGRGSGASENIFKTKGNVKLVACADAFPGKISGAINSLSQEVRRQNRCAARSHVLPASMATRKRSTSDCDLVVIATPPGFKPQQFEYAVNKASTSSWKSRSPPTRLASVACLDAVEESKKKNLMVGIGLQRRHEPRYIETIERIHDGAIGDVIAQRVYWNGGGIWYRNRTDEQTEMAFQTNNWYHFNWLSGDQICEQHIHNLDVGCWVKGEYPVECNGMGGRETANGWRRDEVADL